MAATTVKLDNSALRHLPANVIGPSYDRRKLNAGIVHIGVGGFHRAHQALYVDDVIGEAGASHWGICGVGLLPHDSRMRDALVPQDYLYTVVERGPGADDRARIVGSMDRLPVRARQCRGAAGEDGVAGDPHRLADHHRGRILP
jgi:mannitol 2-dehydrogenase